MSCSGWLVCAVGALLVLCSALTTSAALVQHNLADQDEHRVVAALGGRRLIEFSAHERAWLSEAQVEGLVKRKAHFMDVTDQPHLAPMRGLASSSLPSRLTPRRPGGIEKLLEEVSSSEIAKTISQLSALYTRYYTTATGVEAAKLLHEKYSELGGNKSYISVRFFEHSWAQPSVIARIEGTGEYADELVILGGHEDSVVASSSTGRAPGADDDASGSSSVLEVFRVLAEAGFRGKRSIEFHAYAAEEVGLRGSQAIASAYQKEGKIVAGMMQLDMVGYVNSKSGPVYAVVTDYVNATLTEFVRELAKEYTSLPVKDTKCGYGCSDHASWTKAGYPSAFPFETEFSQINPHIHTSEDTLDKISVEHARVFAQVALAFAVELSVQ